jgi:hypothetical protein
MKLSQEKGHFQDWITQVWVKLTGRKINPSDSSWLMGPIGDVDIIKDKFINSIAKKENLEIISNQPNIGLLNSFEELNLSRNEINKINNQIIDFYEKTSNYNFEVWSEWRGLFKPFGWLLSVIFSKRLQQLNLPLRSLDSAKGIESHIIKLNDKVTQKTKWTVWYRILKSTNHVIYSGVYTTCDLPNFPGKFLKVVFPLPNGNATVIMRREVLEDGSLLLTSDGKKFGDNGFYFTLTNHKTKHWARFVKSMHEWIKVYVDNEKILRADHNLHFYGLPFLNLHYKMTKKHSS